MGSSMTAKIAALWTLTTVAWTTTAGEADRATTSQAMPTALDHIDTALVASPARLDASSFDLRLDILARLDQRLSRADSESDPEVIAYYRQRVDRVLDELEGSRVTEGVVLWKLYSSGFLVKTPLATIGVDLCEGPNEDMYGRERMPFRLTDAQRLRLADAVGYAFHTHHHYDHLSHALATRMAERGTPIFVTRQHARLWQDESFAGRLRVLEPEGESVAVGPLHVRAYHGRQGSDECHAFLIRTDSGVGIWTKGDIYDGDEYAGYLRHLAGTGEAMHLYVSSTWTKRGVDIIDETRRVFDPVFIPAHEWEFTHRTTGEAGVATQSYAINAAYFSEWKARAAILSWGDRLRFVPAAEPGGNRR